MSWEERDYSSPDDQWRQYGGMGGNFRGIRSHIDNPMSWAISLGRVFGITVRVHWLFLAFVVVMLIQQAFADTGMFGFQIVAIGMAALFLIVLVHEFGHCFACRWMRGTADEILMWPLGGLAYCVPPNHWLGHFVTAIGGPAVNVVLCLLLTPLLGLLTGVWIGLAIPNPFSFALPLDVQGSWALITLYLFNEISFVLLLFNLLPMFPLDGGRIAQSLLWPKFGYARSMRFSVRAGFVMAVLLAVLAFGADLMMLFAIAIFGGLACWITLKQLNFTEEMMGFESDDYAASFDHSEPDDTSPKISRAERREAKKAAREREEAEAVDKILNKIAERGIESLTAREKRLLRKETDRKRQQK